MTGMVTVILDMVVIVLLGATITYAVMLNRRLVVLRESRADLENLVKGLAESTTRAESAVKGLRRAAVETGEGLQKTIEQGQALQDDLKMMIESADALANRLEGAASGDRPRSLMPAQTQASSQASSQAPSANSGGGLAARRGGGMPAGGGGRTPSSSSDDSERLAERFAERLIDGPVAGARPVTSGGGSRRPAMAELGPESRSNRESTDNLSRAERELLQALENNR
ncbi:putative DUF6468 domain-containing protein [uncultured Gammaproteobacteria bacterium]